MVTAAPSKEVPCNISANVPISSSATIASPTPAPATPIPVFAIFLPKFNIPNDLPVRLATTAFFARSLAILLPACAPLAKPTIPSGAICANACVNFPESLASASSSKGFKSSKNFSTDAAVFVSPTKSRTSAPKEKNPLGIFHRPV